MQQTEKGDFILGADVLAYLFPIRHPMIMVDRITGYSPSPLSITAERYIPANEPVFSGHFPNLKLWPGVYTIEGLRQTCYLLRVLQGLDKADILSGAVELHKRQILWPRVDNAICNKVIDYLLSNRIPDPDLFSADIKLLEPVFAGSLVKYQVTGDSGSFHSWLVNAMVNEKLVAKGIIEMSLQVG